MRSRFSTTVLLLTLLWALLVLLSLLLRSYVPIDETRYVTVAWEMWLRGDWLVPHLNGQAYAHKPPLLFWLYMAGWWLFGVNDWWPRLVAPLFTFANLWLAALLARRLWPRQWSVAPLTAWILFGSLFWTLYTTAAMFDMLVACFALLGSWGLWRAGQGERGGWFWLGAAIGLGVLAKGPVILLHLLPAALLGPLWSTSARRQRGRWYLHLTAAFLLGTLIALAWAIPAALSGGEAYARAIFWGQTAHRMVDSFAHRRGFFWYLPLLPVIFYPWAWWPVAWRAVIRITRWRDDAGVRFCLSWLLPGFLFLSFISGKQVHYLLPLFPAVALLVARSLSADTPIVGSLRPPALVLMLAGLGLLLLPRWQGLPEWLGSMAAWWGLLPLSAGLLLWWVPASATILRRVQLATLSSVVLVITLYLAMRGPLEQAYDMQPMAQAIARIEAEHEPLVHVTRYAGEYQFLGRLRQPLPVIGRDQAAAWARRHPDGYLIYYFTDTEKQHLPRQVHFIHGYRDNFVALFSSSQYLQWRAAQQP